MMAASVITPTAFNELGVALNTEFTKVYKLVSSAIEAREHIVNTYTEGMGSGTWKNGNVGLVLTKWMSDHDVECVDADKEDVSTLYDERGEIVSQLTYDHDGWYHQVQLVHIVYVSNGRHLVRIRFYDTGADNEEWDKDQITRLVLS